MCANASCGKQVLIRMRIHEDERRRLPIHLRAASHLRPLTVHCVLLWGRCGAKSCVRRLAPRIGRDAWPDVGYGPIVGVDVHGPVSLAQQEEWARARSNAFGPAASDYGFAIEQSYEDRICCGTSWRHIGNVGLRCVDWRNRSATLGIIIGEKSLWGNKFGVEAVWLACRYAFKVLNLHRVEVEWTEGNTRSQGGCMRIGFKDEGVKRHAVFKDGRYLDAHFMSLLDNEFVDDLSAVLSDPKPKDSASS
ncbi:GNAT family N-acetyltransferase [Pelomyxa schiedti]|nr:GNAT family N-acetyltransferase [Pelomyxa schiedti]